MSTRPLPALNSAASRPSSVPNHAHVIEIVKVRSRALTGIFILMLFYTLYFSAPILLPIILALLASLLLRPVVRGLNALYIPPSLGAALVLIALISLLATGVYLLSEPAAAWLERAPHTFREVQIKLRTISEPLEKVQEKTREVEEQVEKLTDLDGESAERVVEIKSPGLTHLVLTGTPQLIAEVVITLILLYFLLASGDSFLRKVVRVTPKLSDKKRAVEIARSIQHDISHYLITITVINLLLGAAVAAVMYLLGVPNALLWGAMTTALNFIPYAGPLVALGVIVLVSLLTFDDPSRALLVPAVFLALTSLEGQFVTPMILGRRLALNPVVIFLSLTVWGWLWGAVGVFVAVPLLVSIKIFCENIEPLQPVAEFLGGESPP